MKPRFFGSLETWKKMTSLDGFYLTRQNKQQKIWGRFQGKEYSLELNENGESSFQGTGFSVRIQKENAVIKEISRQENAGEKMEIDLTYFYILCWLAKAIFSENEINYANF